VPRKYDIESMVADVEVLLKANLATYVAAVEAEQVAAGLPAAFASPAVIDADAYHQFAWNDHALNKNIGVAIFIGDHTTQGEGPYAREQFILDVGVYLSGTQNDPAATRKLLRYSKALSNLFSEKWGKFLGVSREKIETVGPIDFKFNVDSADACKIAGVALTVTLG
jgi:hypothetical protein